MSAAPGTPDDPLRVAIIGSGPSGFYAAESLFGREDLAVEIDMFDRLPTPFGLVRGGVAPDHQKIKSVTKAYDRIAAHPAFHFHGNVELGRDLSREEVLAYHHAAIYAIGAASERRLGIPGEHLPGSYAAAEFVGWYNAHPDYRGRRFHVDCPAAAVIGNGNVAIDVARTLASVPARLREGDMADHAVTALAGSAVRTVYVLGRRGPAQAAFTTKELRELTELPEVDVIVDPADLELDDVSRRLIAEVPDGPRDRNLALLREIAETAPAGHPRRIVFHFLASPTAILGEQRVRALEIGRNSLIAGDDGTPRPRLGEHREVLEVGMVFRAIGYRGTPLPGLPFDDRSGTVPNDRGRVIGGGGAVPREYVAGWIKRGPSGVVGTNKPDSEETVAALLDDLAAGAFAALELPSRDVLSALLAERGVVVDWRGWQRIDEAERERGAEEGRPRRKFAFRRELFRASEGDAPDSPR